MKRLINYPSLRHFGYLKRLFLWSGWFLIAWWWALPGTQAQDSATSYFEGTISSKLIRFDDHLPPEQRLRSKPTYHNIFYQGNLLRRTEYEGELPLIMQHHHIKPSDYLLLGDSVQYKISHYEKAYYRLDMPPLTSDGYGFFSSDPGRIVEATEDTAVILGYTCRKYIVTGIATEINPGDTLVDHYWITPSIRIENYMQKARFFRHNTFLPVELNQGYPLRVDCFEQDESGELVQTRSFVVVAIQPGQVEPMQVPAGYENRKFQ